MEKLKILHVIAINGIGGAEKLQVELLPALKNDIFIVCLMLYRSGTRDYVRQIGTELSKAGIYIHYHRYQNVLSKSILSFLITFVNAHQFQLVHSHLQHADLWFSILKWLRKIKIPVVTTLHGYRDDYHNKYGLTWNNKVKSTVYYRTKKFICSQLDGFIIISGGVSTLFKNAGLIRNKATAIIHHGTKSEVKYRESKETMNYELVVPGRLVSFKGHRYAIAALKLLCERFPQTTLHFYGAGPEEMALRSLVDETGLNDKVIFHGFVPDIVERIRMHDIAVIPSVGEPFGLVFFDAFKAGIPVVAFDLAASNEIINTEQNGLLARPFDAADLAEKISRLFTDAHLRDALVKNGTAVLQEKFSLEKMASKYLNFYQSVINGSLFNK